MSRRGAWIALGIVGVLLGAAAPVGGCSPCPEVVPEGAYRIAEGRAAWVPGSGRVEVSDAAVVITYETSDGSTWEVEYRRVEHAE